MSTARILLIRHGESEANAIATDAELAGAEVIPVRQRDADVPLSTLGEQQAASLGPRLVATFNGSVGDVRVWSSPYRRAVQTAGLALPEGARFALDERLRDRELGIIDALTRKGVDVRLPAEARRREWLGRFYYRPPGGEGWTDLALRIRSFIRDIDWQDDRPVVIFAHDAVVSLFVYVLAGLTEGELSELLRTRTVGNASITTLVVDAEGRWILESFGDDRHLPVAGLPPTDQPRVADVGQA